MARRRRPVDSVQLIYGLHTVERFLRRWPERVLEINVLEGRHDRRMAELLAMAGTIGVRPLTVSRNTLDKLCAGVAHQGVAARVRGQAALHEGELDTLLDGLGEPPLLLVLDGVQDPHNLGACLRCADATGTHAVIAPRDRAAVLSPTVRKVSSGASETVPFVQVTNLARTLTALGERGIRRVGTDEAAGPDLFETDLNGPLALVMGSEGGGLRRLTRERCDVLIRLPMLGTVESLNVSVAAGVCLYFARARRRGAAPDGLA
jgi:23S rRNA (guanosine2251-2'-O)-methyltransferase